MEYDLQFLIMLNTQESIVSVAMYLKEQLLFKISSVNPTFVYKGNKITVKANDYYDPLQVENDDGFLYYAYRIECLPVKTISLVCRLQRLNIFCP